MANLAYLSLGSNIQPEENLPAAIELLAARSKLLAVSPVWETRPVGRAGQPNYLNAAALVETGLTAQQFKGELLHHIEQSLGRVRGPDKYGPRTIDIDLILFNREIFELDGRHIPSPELFERAFVAIPLAEIAPDYQHPETGQTLRQIAQQLTAAGREMQLRPDISQQVIAIKDRP